MANPTVSESTKKRSRRRRHRRRSINSSSNAAAAAAAVTAITATTACKSSPPVVHADVALFSQSQSQSSISDGHQRKRRRRGSRELRSYKRQQQRQQQQQQQLTNRIQVVANHSEQAAPISRTNISSKPRHPSGQHTASTFGQQQQQSPNTYKSASGINNINKQNNNNNNNNNNTKYHATKKVTHYGDGNDADDESDDSFISFPSSQPPEDQQQKQQEDAKEEEEEEEEEEELEEPYFQKLDFPGAKNVIHISATRRGATKTQQEPLRAGDVVEYYHPMAVAGTKQGHRITRVVGVNPSGNPFVLELDNGELLPGDTRIKRTQIYLPKEDTLVDHGGVYRQLEDFRLVAGVLDCNVPIGFDRKVSQIKNQLKHGRHEFQAGFKQIYHQHQQSSSSDFTSSDHCWNSDSDSDRSEAAKKTRTDSRDHHPLVNGASKYLSTVGKRDHTSDSKEMAEDDCAGLYKPTRTTEKSANIATKHLKSASRFSLDRCQQSKMEKPKTTPRQKKVESGPGVRIANIALALCSSDSESSHTDDKLKSANAKETISHRNVLPPMPPPPSPPPLQVVESKSGPPSSQEDVFDFHSQDDPALVGARSGLSRTPILVRDHVAKKKRKSATRSMKKMRSKSIIALPKQNVAAESSSLVSRRSPRLQSNTTATSSACLELSQNSNCNSEEVVESTTETPSSAFKKRPGDISSVGTANSSDADTNKNEKEHFSTLELQFVYTENSAQVKKKRNKRDTTTSPLKEALAAVNKMEAEAKAKLHESLSFSPNIESDDGSDFSSGNGSRHNDENQQPVAAISRLQPKNSPAIGRRGGGKNTTKTIEVKVNEHTLSGNGLKRGISPTCLRAADGNSDEPSIESTEETKERQSKQGPKVRAIRFRKTANFNKSATVKFTPEFPLVETANEEQTCTARPEQTSRKHEDSDGADWGAWQRPSQRGAEQLPSVCHTQYRCKPHAGLSNDSISSSTPLSQSETDESTMQLGKPSEQRSRLCNNKHMVNPRCLDGKEQKGCHNINIEDSDDDSCEVDIRFRPKNGTPAASTFSSPGGGKNTKAARSRSKKPIRLSGPGVLSFTKVSRGCRS